jgi:nitrate reductase delta subunit
METSEGAYRILATALGYPSPGLAASLQEGIVQIPEGPARQAYQSFVEAIRKLSLGEWEELYTRTLDLNPAVAPYIGYQLWGDSYPRGNFMAALNRAYREAQLELDGELPDHLACVLAYLGSGQTPLPELAEALDPAVQKMLTTLRKAEADNPYACLLEAVAAIIKLRPAEKI